MVDECKGVEVGLSGKQIINVVKDHFWLVQSFIIYLESTKITHYFYLQT